MILYVHDFDHDHRVHLIERVGGNLRVVRLIDGAPDLIAPNEIRGVQLTADLAIFFGHVDGVYQTGINFKMPPDIQALLDRPPPDPDEIRRRARERDEGKQ